MNGGRRGEGGEEGLGREVKLFKSDGGTWLDYDSLIART